MAFVIPFCPHRGRVFFVTSSPAENDDARYALYDVIGKELFPSGMEAEFYAIKKATPKTKP
jgi:hypothetical protein